ncbi:hypothetical protein OH491_27385 (plasmid) [Termitidicoccus mucosus]|uniref:hypothetical protein n=1 Tax=Termitidicoccus mucosus TaxID=1184151 RepID=UPI0031830254
MPATPISPRLESAYKEALEKDKVDLTHLARGLDTVTDLDGNSHPRRFGFVAADINKGLRYGIGYTWDGNPVYQSYSDHHLHRGRTGNPMMLHTAESPAELLDKVNKWHAAFLAKTPRYSVRTIGPSSSEIDRISFTKRPHRLFPVWTIPTSGFARTSS